MNLIIFGINNRQKTLNTGKFHCPHCRMERYYEHRQSRQYFSIYFIPLIPISSPVEYIECLTCHQAFSLDVLNVRISDKPKTKPDLARLINDLPAILAGGEPIDYLLRDLTAAGLNRDSALQMMPAGQKTCKTCGLSYAPGVTTCKECGSSL